MMAMSANGPVKWFLVIDGEAGDRMTVLKATRPGRGFHVHSSVGGNNRSVKRQQLSPTGSRDGCACVRSSQAQSRHKSKHRYNDDDDSI